MRLAWIPLFLLLSCAQPIDAPVTTTLPAIALGPEYVPFDGVYTFSFPGYHLTVDFEGNVARAECVTANATVRFRYMFTLDGGTITTYAGEYPIIWHFECERYPYRWDGTTLIVTDPVNDRILVLAKE